MKEIFVKIGAGVLIFLFGGIFLPLIFLEPFHQNELYTLIGIVGSFGIVIPFAIYILYSFNKTVNGEATDD